jgi:hypothetical protein
LNAINLLGQLNAGHFGVMGSLGTQPVARAQSQKAAEAQIRDAGTSMALANRYWLMLRGWRNS